MCICHMEDHTDDVVLVSFSLNLVGLLWICASNPNTCGGNRSLFEFPNPAGSASLGSSIAARYPGPCF